MQDGIPSPIFVDSLPLFRKRLLDALESLRIPIPVEKDPDCHRDCHITERNHTIQMIKELLLTKGMQAARIE